MILPPTSQTSHHHKVTNITMSPTSLSPISTSRAYQNNLFVGYTLNQLFLFGDSEWSKEQFRDCPIWAKKRMQDLFKHVR